MTCEKIEIDGWTAIVCGGRPRAACEVCHRRPHDVLCDYPLAGYHAGKTCDMKLCASCAKHVGANSDLCPPHAKLGLPQLELALGGVR